MSRAARAYIFTVIALGVIAAARALFRWIPQDFLQFFFYLIVAVPASGLKVRLPGVTGTFSVLFLFVLAGVVGLGLPETLVMSSICVLVQSYWRPRVSPRPVQVLFSIASLCLAATAADFMYHLDTTWLRESEPLRLALAAGALYLANTVPVAGVIALTENKPAISVWTEHYRWMLPYYLLGASIVGLFGFINRTFTWQALVLIAPVVFTIYRSYLLYVNHVDNERERIEEERRHAEEVARLLAQTMEANAALRRANEDLEQFAYAASHDLQEPLRMIIIYSQLLERRHYDSLGPEGKQLLRTISEGAYRINDLVRDLLSYTRVESVDRTTPSRTSPGEVLAGVQQSLLDRITSLDATITTDELPAVAVHRAHLAQLLQNLLSNALKYHSPERAPRIHISSAPAGDDMIEFLVRDNGIGIDPAYYERIFGVFKRLHSRAVPGTGIGLAICRKIVRQYGGGIWVESVVGVGSTFHFTLPRSEGQPGAAQPEDDPESARSDAA